MDVGVGRVPASHRERRVERGWDPNCKTSLWLLLLPVSWQLQPSFLTSSGTGRCMGTSHALTR